jgi:hypothetical protein
MSNETTRPTSGQETDPSSNPLTEIIAILRGIGTRLDILEQRFEYLDRDCLKAIKAASLPVPEHLIEERPATEEDDDEPLVEPGPDPTPALALRSDGAVLLSPEYLDAASLKGRVVWTGIVLSYAEACDALDALNGAACDAGAHIGGRLIALAKKKAKGAPEGGDAHE